MKKNSPMLYFSILLLLILAGCRSSPVLVDSAGYGPVDMSIYQTFDFFQIDAENSENPEFKKNIQYLQKAIATEMQNEGLRQTTSNPDLKINLGIVVTEKVQTRETNLATDPFMYIGQRSYTWKVEEVQVGTYKEGTLTLHLVENKSEQAIWVGTIRRALPKKVKNTPETIDKVVEILFEEMTQ
ncbi:DUF4136 domain-containing protein [Cyclobacterium plantarum]|uniref:DUF4136 domain-containing protein n=1 Tax=Cyclobacterium plantarum TaxID=2716263 RepID=A0ABX0H1W3_9BACT|nr:DUF4136 domain-containing protein [Cyclobacterium plantarum]NHE55770.1 DUF4136 domain-containing protein [Cyclobacterium plantarum]